MTGTRTTWPLVLAGAFVAAGLSTAPVRSGERLDWSALEIPAAPGSRYPDVAAAPDGSFYVCWLEPTEGTGYRLRFCHISDARAAPPATIAEGDNWFVNWADFPSIAAGPGGRLAAHWLERNGTTTYAYGVRISLSSDGGRHWTPPVWLHDDRTPNEHGFVSLVPCDEGFVALWLDSRDMQRTGQMGLWSRPIDPRGRLGAEELLDPSVCQCCQTSAIWSDERIVAVYRDRRDDQVRDISLVSRRTDSAWGVPRTVFDDGWFIPT